MKKTQAVDLYGSDIRLREARKAIENSELLCQENKRDILSFLDEKQGNITQLRQIKLAYMIRQIGEWLEVPFREATKEDIIQVVNHIDGNGYADTTRYDYKVIIRLYWKWLYGDEDIPDIVKFIKPRQPKREALNPDDLLTIDDVVKIADVARHPRDRCIMKVLFEGGFRISELLTLQMKNVEEGKDGYNLHIRKSKTDLRKVFIYLFQDDLRRWFEMHPGKNDPAGSEMPLFCDLKDGRRYITRAAVAKQIKKCARLVRITKHVNPHAFRHASANFWRNRGLADGDMKYSFGWKQDSRMLNVYLHPDADEVINSKLKILGVKEQSKEEKLLHPRECPGCGHVNSVKASACSNCRRGLDAKQARMEQMLINHVDSSFDELVKEYPEVLGAFLNRVRKEVEALRAPGRSNRGGFDTSS